MMKLSKWLTSIAITITLLGSSATVLSANTNVNAASKYTKVNGYYKNAWPHYLTSGKYYAPMSNFGTVLSIR